MGHLRMRQLDSISDSMDMNLSKLWEIVCVPASQAMGQSQQTVDHNKLQKILKEKGIPDHLTCLQRNLYAGQEAAVRNEHGTTDWFQNDKEVHQGCILSPYLFILYADYIM